MPVRRQVTIGTPRKNQRRNRVPHGGRLASLKRTSSSLSRAGALPGRPMCRFPRRPAAPCARTSGAMSAIRAGRSRLFHGREAHRCKHWIEGTIDGDPVPVGGGFGFSGNQGRPLGHLAERCAIYLQPHHILLGCVCDRFARCDSACRESNHLFLPKHQTLSNGFTSVT